jgi:hypothetical protein
MMVTLGTRNLLVDTYLSHQTAEEQMPTPHEMLLALNQATTECGMTAPVGSLMHTTYITNGTVACFTFAGTLLEKVGGNMAPHFPTAATPDGTFFNFALMGEPSSLNHSFCVYFWRLEVLLMQTYINKVVPLLQIMSRADLLNGIADLQGQDPERRAAAYTRMFRVDGDGFKPHSFYATRV